METQPSSQDKKKRIADNSGFWAGMAAVLAPMSDSDCQCLGIAIAEELDEDKRKKAKDRKAPKIAER